MGTPAGETPSGEPKTALKVGDRVRVLPVVQSLPTNQDIPGAPWVTSEMFGLVGRTLEIAYIEETDYAKEAFEAGGWWWIREWLEKVTEGEALPKPSPAEGSPAPLAKGPSLDLEAAREALARHLYYMKRPDWDKHEWEDRPSAEYRKSYYGEADHILNIVRAALGKAGA